MALVTSSSIALAVVLVTGTCTGRGGSEVPSTAPTSAIATSPTWSRTVVPDVVGENFLEAMVAVDPPFRLVEVTSRISSAVPNGTILRQRPPAGTTFHSTDPEVRIRVVVSITPG